MQPAPDRLRTALADRYAIEGALGEGGMATVYRARDLKHRRPVAIKVLRPELAAAIGPERFLREIEIAAGLQHPRILPLYDSGEADGLLYYVMPLVEGESLRDRLDRERQLPLEDALRITREVASALSYAHARGVVHRDIKPDNILLTAGEAVVADFGIARALDAAGGARLTATGVALGTPVYMSPEQAAGEREVDGRSDLYSLGCVLYEMVAGQPPFVGPTAESVLHQHVAAPAPRVTTIRPTATATLERVIERALAKAPADRFATASQFAEALGVPDAVPSLPVPVRRFRRALLGTAGLVVVAAAALLLVKRPAHAALNPNLIAIAPFEVLAPGQEVWHEGMADRLARGLDDAGPLRTVSPTVVVRRWEGRADPASADALGQRTGAGLVVFGSIERAGGDSVRLLAALRDVESGHTLAEREIRGSAERMDLLVDSATVVLLNELSRVRTIGAVRAVSLGSRSLPALKAFLRAEQFYRRTAWDSVEYYATRAVQLDSTFALARRRVSLARGWQSFRQPTPEGTRAGDFNHGLSPRDSLLLLAFQLGELSDGSDSDSNAALARREFRLLTAMTTRYADDPEVWYELGELMHHAVGLLVSRRSELEVWQRSIALDPAFGPSYYHAVELSLEFFGLDSARRYANAYVALDPTNASRDAEADGTRLVAELLRAAPALPAALDQRIAAMSAGPLSGAALDLARWPDSTETAVRLLRQAVANAGPGGLGRYVRRALNAELAFRGHVAEAWKALQAVPATLDDLPQRTGLALAGVLPADSARRLFAGPSSATLSFRAAPWWSAVGDTTSLAVLGRRAEAEAGRLRGRLGADRGAFESAAAAAWHALARHDSATALRGFGSLNDSACAACASERLEHALLLSAARRDAEAVALLDGDLVAESADVQFIEILWMLERARVNERLGRRDAARRAYQYVADVWRNADAGLQGYVTEARSALRRL